MLDTQIGCDLSILLFCLWSLGSEEYMAVVWHEPCNSWLQAHALLLIFFFVSLCAQEINQWFEMTNGVAS